MLPALLLVATATVSPCASAPPACRAAAQSAILAWREDAEECGFARRECVADLKAAESTLEWLTASSSTTPAHLARGQEVEAEGWGFWAGAGLGAGVATLVAVVAGVLVATR